MRFTAAELEVTTQRKGRGLVSVLNSVLPDRSSGMRMGTEGELNTESGCKHHSCNQPKAPHILTSVEPLPHVLLPG